MEKNHLADEAPPGDEAPPPLATTSTWRRNTGIGNANHTLTVGQAKLKQSPSEPQTITNPSLDWISPKTKKLPGMEKTEASHSLVLAGSTGIGTLKLSAPH